MTAALRAFARPRVWLGMWIFGWVLAIVLSLIPQPPIELDVPDSDKIGHLLSYAALSAWAVMLFARPRAWTLAALALVALGVGMEFAQGALTQTRLGEPLDALANALGAGLGMLIGLTRMQFSLQSLDRRWFS